MQTYQSKFTPASAPVQQLYSYTLTRDVMGRISGKTETVLGVTDTYVYSYDTNGNRTSGSVGGVAFNATYDDQDRLASWNAKNYSYNANGELIQVQDSLTTSTYTYDAMGMIKSANIPGQAITYEQDAEGRRASTTVNGPLDSRFLYEDQYRIALEVNNSGVASRYYVYGTHLSTPDYMYNSGNLYRILRDHLGSPRLTVRVTDAQIRSRIDYDEWGKIIGGSNKNFHPYGFAGGIKDANTGLVRFGARDYDPETGRWTSKDPILFNGGDTNLYGYVMNDPINFIDPSGLTQEQIDNALSWLRQSHPSITNGMDNWSVRDGWLPYQGGLTLPGNNIRINTCGMDDADVVDAVSHELMHARDGFWRSILGMGRNHNSIYDAAARLGNQYRNK